MERTVQLVLLRPRKINTLFPISCLEKIGSVGREMFFFILTFYALQNRVGRHFKLFFNKLCSSK